jgi:hypothetical protein
MGQVLLKKGAGTIRAFSFSTNRQASVGDILNSGTTAAINGLSINL